MCMHKYPHICVLYTAEPEEPFPPSRSKSGRMGVLAAASVGPQVVTGTASPDFTSLFLSVRPSWDGHGHRLFILATYYEGSCHEGFVPQAAEDAHVYHYKTNILQAHICVFYGSRQCAGQNKH